MIGAKCAVGGRSLYLASERAATIFLISKKSTKAAARTVLEMSNCVCLLPSGMDAVRYAILFTLAAVSIPAFSLAAAVTENREVLGLRLSMTAAEARARLEKVGEFVRDERKKQQIWKVRDDHFSHVIVALDKQDRVRFITAVARKDAEAKQLEYESAGQLDRARQAGDVSINNFNYEWTLAAEKNEPEMMVIARGRDPKFLDTLTLKRLDAESDAAKK